MMYSMYQSLGLLASPTESYTTKQFTVSPIIMFQLPDVAAQFHVGAAAAAPRASRAGLPLCGSGPDNVWQCFR